MKLSEAQQEILVLAWFNSRGTTDPLYFSHAESLTIRILPPSAWAGDKEIYLDGRSRTFESLVHHGLLDRRAVSGGRGLGSLGRTFRDYSYSLTTKGLEVVKKIVYPTQFV